jgi:hypothetical protein
VTFAGSLPSEFTFNSRVSVEAMGDRPLTEEIVDKDPSPRRLVTTHQRSSLNDPPPKVGRSDTQANIGWVVGQVVRARDTRSGGTPRRWDSDEISPLYEYRCLTVSLVQMRQRQSPAEC